MSWLQLGLTSLIECDLIDLNILNKSHGPQKSFEAVTFISSF